MSGDRHYSGAVWSNFVRPHRGHVEEDAGGLRSGEAGTPASEAVLALHIQVEGGRIRAASFQAYGCVSTIAAGSWVARWLEGRSLQEAVALEAEDIDRALALAPEKRFCALLAKDALQAALAGKDAGAN